MSTYADLKAAVLRTLQDGSAQTFTPGMQADIVQAAYAELGRLCPQRFQTDIDPVANSLKYGVMAPGVTTVLPEVELTRVEIWDGSQTPNEPLLPIPPADGEYDTWSEVGWKLWDGYLFVPTWVPSFIKGHENDYNLRVWGYSPYQPLVADVDVSPFSHEREQALLLYARVIGLAYLTSSRELYTQWQTRSGNSDVSFAGLLSAQNTAEQSWHKKSRAIQVLREAPG